MENSSSDPVALARWQLVSQVHELLRQHWPLSAALEHIVASCPLHHTDGSLIPVSKRTLETWFYRHQKEGFDALRSKPRKDRGKPRRLSPEQQQRILEQVRSFPGLAVKVFYQQWKKSDPSLPSVACVYRWLEHNQLDAGRRYLLRQSPTGPTKSFEAPVVNDLWMVDFSPGPFLPASPRALGTHLCLFIDDHSRLIPYAAYHLQADTKAFLFCLREAVKRRGLPRKLYTDHGGPFINEHTKVVCANLGIRLLHAKPYHAWSKGKVEKMFGTLQRGFEETLRLPGQGVGSLEELNARFSGWLQEIYHCRVHSTTAETPQERFAKGASSLRLLDPQLDLDRLFFHRIERLVRNDGTVRIASQFYELDLALRGLTIELHFDPWKMNRIEVRYRGQDFGLARKLDRHQNSQLGGGPR